MYGLGWLHRFHRFRGPVFWTTNLGQDWCYDKRKGVDLSRTLLRYYKRDEAYRVVSWLPWIDRYWTGLTESRHGCKGLRGIMAWLVTVEPIGASGGLALFYNNEYDVKIEFSNKRIIDVKASYEGKVVFMSFVYGDPVVKLRDLVWERITRIGTTRTDPWFLIGDFNEITRNHEKQGGPLRQASTFIPFNLMISDCGFVDFPSRGNTLSFGGDGDEGG
ncbi:unnamed protein product [Microthlaspi erraticum]|uniref:Endonuclease/exonuclease/phosphatase domain-containing protein n=1 Tax=Microthlaspi erraticum TaxID=1685480 RepID=A0A6D2HMF0_9BRAS|nr:unnamed protein product [Microthlaspi erraticum]CAA7023823.1 unnamed protein product [Microthlaspi erraticum]